MPPPPPAAAAAHTWLGTWSRPPDGPAQVALGAALALLVAALVPGGPRWLVATIEFASLADLARRRRFLTVASFVAAFMSLGYIAFYLRGGPRAAEAAGYWLQGRALSHGELAWKLSDPAASFRGRYLLFGLPDRLSGIFPPGYPLLLAVGFLFGAPMLVGPLLAAALVLAAWLLAREVAVAAGEHGDRAEWAARIAVGMSLVSAAVRYHTADAVPHGAAAMAVAMAMACALRARRTREVRLLGVAGLALGWLCATQPASAIPSGAIVLAIASRAEARARALAWVVGASLPGVMLLSAADHAATGHWLASPMAAYANVAEHHARAPLDLRAIATRTALYIRAHLLDVCNFEPLALLALVPVLRRGRTRVAILAALVVAGQILTRAALSGENLTPSVGASALADVLPIEHALMALALVSLFPRSLASATTATFGVALAGFALHASYEHEALAASGLGRPHFEPDTAREANVTHGLLFFDDDEGFELAHDPSLPASHGIEAVRMRGDDHDRLLYDSLGHPAIHRYVANANNVTVPVWSPPGSGSETWRFEAESEWPPASQTGGWSETLDVLPTSTTSSSALRGDVPPEGRALVVTPTGAAEATVVISLPVPRGPTPPERRTWMVAPRVVQRGGAGTATLEALADVAGPRGPPLATWSWADASRSAPIGLDLPPQPIELGGERARAWLVVRARGGPVALDRTTLRAR